MGSNHKQAQNLADKINPDFAFVEEKCVQQTDVYSCGIHLQVNSKYVIYKLISNDNNESNLLHVNIERCKQINEHNQPMHSMIPTVNYLQIVANKQISLNINKF